MKIALEANRPVVEHMVKLATVYSKRNDQNRANTFFKVANTLRNLEDFIDEAYDVTKHDGIGPSTKKEVLQFLKTGTSDRLVKLLEDGGDMTDPFDDVSAMVRMDEELMAELPTDWEGHLLVATLGKPIDSLEALKEAIPNLPDELQPLSKLLT